MGFFDSWNDGVSVASHSSHRRSSRKHKKRRSDSRSPSRSSSRSRRKATRSVSGSIFGGDKYDRHNASRGSFFGGDKYDKHNASRGSFFGLGGNGSRSSFFKGSGSSYYKRQPRQGFIQSSYKKLKRLLRDLIHWAKRHPWKVFFLVIMPLVTGGALTALLARFGLRMPKGIERMLGMASRAASGDSFGVAAEAVRMATDFGGSGAAKVERGREGGYEWERKTSYGGSSPSWGDMAGIAGGIAGNSGGGGGGWMSYAKKFLD